MTVVIDTSAAVSLAVGGVWDDVLGAFAVVTTETVVAELEATAEYDDIHGDAATTVLAARDRVDVIAVEGERFETSRIDGGEATCVAAVERRDAAFLVTDDFRALPELEAAVDAKVALSAVVVRALVKRGVLSDAAARRCVERMAEERDWYDTPLYRYALSSFE